MDNSPGENVQSNTKTVSLAYLSYENSTEIERILKLEESIRHKDKFIRELGESKDEDAHEFDLQKARLLDEVEQLNAKLNKLTSEMESVRADLEAERSRSLKLDAELSCKLEAELHEQEEMLQTVRNRDYRSFTESNFFGESAEKALQAKLTEVEKNLRRSDDDNAKLLRQIEQMDANFEETVRELDNLRDYNASLLDTVDTVQAELCRVKEEKDELSHELAARSKLEQASALKPSNMSLQEELNEINVNCFNIDDYSRLTQEAADWRRKYENLVAKNSTKDKTTAQNPFHEPRQCTFVTHQLMSVDLVTPSSSRRPSQNSFVRIVSTGFWLSMLLVVFVMLRFAFCVFYGADGVPCTLFGGAPPLRRIYMGIEGVE